MRRKLFNLASAASLLLCAAMVALWVRGYSVADDLGWVCRDVNLSLPAEEWFTRRIDIGVGSGIVGFNSEQIIWAKAYPHYRQHSGTWRWRFDGWEQIPSPRRGGAIWDGRPDPLVEQDTFMQRRGFGWWDHPAVTVWNDYDSQFIPTHEFGFCVPSWVIALAAAVLPTRLWRIYSRRTHGSSGRCARCGYDLRATPDRCPECGTPVAKKDVAAKPAS